VVQLAGLALISMIAAYVGLDPKKDLTLVDVSAPNLWICFAEGKLDTVRSPVPGLTNRGR
jgi:hypothetical protein